jgi:NADH-quinone oxidoreductase subunit G
MSSVARRADVVLPIAPAVEKAGSYVDWEGRVRPFETVLRTPAMSDARVLDALARELGVELRTGDIAQARAELAALAHLPLPGATTADMLEKGPGVLGAPAPRAAPGEPLSPTSGQAILATWHHLLDNGSLQDGDGHLAGTARIPVVRIPKSTAADLGVVDGDAVTVGTARGAITLPALITDMADGVVWVPTNSPGSTVRRTLGVVEGALVDISAGGVR